MFRDPKNEAGDAAAMTSLRLLAVLDERVDRERPAGLGAAMPSVFAGRWRQNDKGDGKDEGFGFH